MRFIGVLRPEGPCDERVSRTSAGHAFGQRAGEREQHRTRLASETTVRCLAHDVAARVHDQRVRRQQRFDLLEQERALLAARDQARRGRVQDEGCAFDLRRQRRNAGLARGALGPGERGARRLRPETPHRNPRNDQFVRVRDAGGKGRGSSPASARSASSRRPIRSRRRTSRCRACAAFTRSPCSSSVARAASSAFAGQPRSRETSAISASATTHRARATASFGPKARAALRSRALARDEIAELRHRDAAKRERRRVVAQGDPLQRAERITRCERPRRGRDQRVHRNPATLVTLAIRCPLPIIAGPTTSIGGHCRGTLRLQLADSTRRKPFLRLWGGPVAAAARRSPAAEPAGCRLRRRRPSPSWGW